MNRSNDYKICLLGKGVVGKTCLLTRIKKDIFEKSIVATFYLDLTLIEAISSKKTKYKLKIWDCSGNYRMEKITKKYYRAADLIVLSYCITNRTSFEQIPEFIDEINAETETSIILVATMQDLDAYREVTEKEGKELAMKYNIPFIETSAKTGYNIPELRDLITDNLTLLRETFYQVILIGNSFIGKTELFMHLIGKHITSEAPLIADLNRESQVLTKSGEKISILYTDTTGNSKLEILKDLKLKNIINAFLLIYDITNKESFDDIPQWVKLINETFNKNITIILIGNKQHKEDLRVITVNQGIDLAMKFKISFFEVSAKTGYGQKKLEDLLYELAIKTKNSLKQNKPLSLIIK